MGRQTSGVDSPGAAENKHHAGQTPGQLAVVVLAAGAGSRFAATGHKLSALLAATATEPAATVLERAVRHALAADIGPVIVVTGAAPDVVTPAIRDDVLVHHNPRWAEGQITSLHVGIEAAQTLGADAVAVGLGDQPFIEPTAWRAIADGPGPIVIATYAQRRGNPVRIDSAVWELLPTEGDEGARALIRVRPDLVREVPCEGSPDDIDTTEDLRRWQSN